MISQTTEYALRAIVDLAYHFGDSRTTQQIASATHVPASYLAKILKDLSRARLVRSQRGLHGGFSLDRDPKSMTVYDVMAAVDPPRRILACPLGLEAHRKQLCPLHQRLDDAMAAAEKAFRATTIAEVTAERNDSSTALGGSSATLTISGGLAATSKGKRIKTKSKSASKRP